MTLIIIIMALLFLIGIEELADWLVYRNFADEEAEKQLIKKLDEYCFASKDMIHWKHYDFVSKKWGLSSRWYIYKDGHQQRIFIKSKINKILDDKLLELLKVEELKRQGELK